jgi:hypothetical protein
MHFVFALAVSPNGEGRIRTSEGIRRQIYSLLPLATRVPLRSLEPMARLELATY